LWYWSLNSGPTPWATPPAPFLWLVFSREGRGYYLPGLIWNQNLPDLYLLSG
jgi:hypothetical protein